MSQPSGQPADTQTLAEIARAIRGIRYGQVIVTIHDERVVEIASTEKKRLARS